MYPDNSGSQSFCKSHGATSTPATRTAVAANATGAISAGQRAYQANGPRTLMCSSFLQCSTGELKPYHVTRLGSNARSDESPYMAARPAVQRTRLLSPPAAVPGNSGMPGRQGSRVYTDTAWQLNQ